MQFIRKDVADISSENVILDGLNKAADGKWYYYTDGKINTEFTGMAKNEYGWWYMKNGQIVRTYTGLAQNEYGWWYMKNGQVYRTFTGKITYQGVTYSVNKGKVAK